MAINIHCACKSDSHLNAKKCGKCGTLFPADRKYRVVVKGMDGKRVSKVVDTIQQAKKLETKLKANIFERRHLGLRDQFTLGAVWEKYLVWAKGNKKTWRDDVMLWEKHIAPILAVKPMEQITAGYKDPLDRPNRHIQTVHDRSPRMPQGVEPEVANTCLLTQSSHELLPILKRPHLGFACLAAGVIMLRSSKQTWHRELFLLVGLSVQEIETTRPSHLTARPVVE